MNDSKVHSNISHNESIWKDHVRQELTSQLIKWPYKWGFLIGEYDKLNRELDTREPPDDSEEVEWRISGDIRLPPIPQIRTLKEGRKKFPETTSGLIGWKAQKDLKLHSYLWWQKTKGSTSLLKQLGWPIDASP